MTKPKIIQQGAEANIILSGRFRKKPFIIKDRVKKGYRIPELDIKIRTRRTKSEAKLLEKASKIINSPNPFLQPSIRNSSKLKMPFIDGKKLSDYLDKFPLKKQKEVCKLIGENIAKLHDADIIHGDLTTSNMILVENKGANKKTQRIESLKSRVVGGVDGGKEFIIYFIDFGLGFISHKFEDKAVDIHLLKQALEAKHFKNWEILFKEILKGYSKSKDSKIVLERLNKVEKRGRYK